MLWWSPTRFRAAKGTRHRRSDPNLPTTIPPLLQVMQDYNRLNTTPSNQPAAIANSRRSPPKPTQKPNRKKKGNETIRPRLRRSRELTCVACSRPVGHGSACRFSGPEGDGF